MLTLEMSPVFANEFVKRIVGNDSTHRGVSNTGAGNTPMLDGQLEEQSGGGLISSSIAIMSGVMPADINTVISRVALTPYILVNFSSWASIQPGTSYNGPSMIINTTYVPAIASGRATWFLGYTQLASGGVAIDTIGQAFMGTIGITGTGADLEIPNTTVTATVPYAITNLTFQFPTSW